MSWWGNWDKGLSKMASTALKQAQKKIDKVLDIQEGEEGDPRRGNIGVLEEPVRESPTLTLSSNETFFQEWLGDQPEAGKNRDESLKLEQNTQVSLMSERTNFTPALKTDPVSDTEPKKERIARQGDSLYSQDPVRQNESISATLEDVSERPLSLKMTESQITTVGDWTMSDSAMLTSQLDFDNDKFGVSSSTSFSDDQVDVKPREKSPTLGDSNENDMKNSKLETEREVPELATNMDPKQQSHQPSKTVDADGEDDECLYTNMGDRSSHLSLSSDCTDLTLRGDDCGVGSRGISPSEQLTQSKDSSDSVYSNPARSLQSEPLIETVECKTDSDDVKLDVRQTLESSEPHLKSFTEEKPRIQDQTVECKDLDITEIDEMDGHDDEQINASHISQKSSDIPLELSLPDQPATLPASSFSNQPETSPTGVAVDESETGTSSDIEVISSCCTSNNGGDHNLPSAGFDGHHVIRLSSHTRSVSDCSFLSNIVESNASDENLSHEALSKKLSEVKEVLEARESKLLQMSKENIDLRETNNILRQQLNQSELARQDEMTDINALTVEFTNRIGEAEKRLQNAAREKEQLKKKVQRLEADLGNKSEERRCERLVTEKQEQIDELLVEGERMAQEQLKTNNIVKKLRSKERELDAALQAQSARADKLEAENEHLKKVVDNRDENEKQHVDAINQLTRAVQKQDKEILQYKRQLEESQEKARSLQNNLEAAYKELSELHKSNAAAASEAAHATFSAEVAAREHAKAAVAEVEASWTDERRVLRSELEELRFSLATSEREFARREEQLRGEIEYLHGRLSAAEQRNEELTTGLGSATRPVLRQLEALQASFSTQSATWEQTERQLNDRLLEAQKALSTAAEQERCWRERGAELEGRLSALESQTTTLRQDKGRLTAALQADRARAELLEEEKHRLLAQLEAGRAEWRTEREELRKELVLAGNSLELARSQLEVERRRGTQLSDRALAAERRAAEQEERRRAVSGGSQDASGQSTPKSYRQPSGSGAQSLYALLREHNASGGAALLEHLQASVQQKDGDIAQLHREVQQMDKTREALILDMMMANQKAEELQSEVTKLEGKLSDQDALEKRYNALLQMYGEKMEENEELRLDLQDVKEMYKAQIDLLTQGK